MALPETVKTDVDSLTELIKEKREISFEDASKILGLPLSTIEAWASFLEEEGIVTLKYKFTKPFFVYKKEAKIFPKKKPEKALEEEKPIKGDIPLYLNRINALLKQLEQSAEAERYAKLNVFGELIQEIKRLKEEIKSEVGLEKDVEARIDNDIAEAEKILSEIPGHIANKDVKGTRQKTTRLIEILKQNFLLLKSLFEEEKLIEKREIAKIEGPAEDLIKKAYEYIKQGKFQSALDAYSHLEEKYEHLPEEFLEKKNMLKNDLIKLNRDLAYSLSESSSTVIESKTKEINELIKKAMAALKKNDIYSAADIYENIENIFKDLPHGFLDERTMLQHKIVELQENLISKKRFLFFQDMRRKTREINGMLSEIRNLISREKIGNAVQKYQKVRGVFATLPQGFLQEKTELQNTILNIYREILANKTQSKIGEMQKMTGQIETLLSQIPTLVARNDIKNANTFFEQIEKIYKSLPAGFLPQKTELQNKILKMSEMIAKRLDSISIADFNRKEERIKGMLKNVQELVKGKQYDLAFAEYGEIVNIYNKMPPGFLKRKTDMRNNILNLYRSIMLGSDLVAIDNVNEKKKYMAMLKILVRIHQYIDQGEFDMIEIDYERLSELYNEFPIGFLQQKTRIVEEVMNMYKKVEMLKRLNEVKESMEKGDYEKANKNLFIIAQFYNELTKSSPEDNRLYTYVYEIYSKYVAFSHHVKPVVIVPKSVTSAIGELRNKIVKTEQSLSDFKYVEPLA